MVAANNAAFFAVLFLETTFVDLFVVCNNRIKRNHIVSILFFFFVFFARASFAYACSKEGRCLPNERDSLKSLEARGDKDQKFSQSNPIQSDISFSPRKEETESGTSLSLSLSFASANLNEYSAIFTLKAVCDFETGKRTDTFDENGGKRDI